MKRYFKIVAFAAAALFSLVFASCEKDDVSNSVVGTWEITSYKFSNALEMEEDDDDGFQIGDTITFYEDGRYEDSEETGRWTKEGNVLTIIFDDEDSEDFYLPVVLNITKLTNTVLEVNLDYIVLKIELKMKRVK